MLVFQVSAFCIYMVIFLCWIIPKKLNIYNSLTFIFLLFSIGLSIISDFVSSYLGYYNLVPPGTQAILFKLFMIMLVSTSYLNFAYLVSRSIEGKTKNKIAQFSIIAPILSIVLILVLPISIVITEDAFDIVGPSVYCAYICALLYLLLIMFTILVARKNLNVWYRVCFIVSAVTWAIAALIQFFSTYTGIMSVAFVCTLIALFIFIENPLNYVNHDFNCFKNNYIYSYLDSIIKKGKGGFAIFVDINWSKEGEDNNNIVNIKKDFIAAFDEYKDSRVFIDESYNIYVASKIKDNYKKFKVLVERLIDEKYNAFPDKMFFRAEVICCSDISLFNHADEYVSYVKIDQEKLLRVSGYYASHEITPEEIENEHKDDFVKDEIVRALNEDRVEAFVQPIYSVKKGKIVSAEALSRIRNTDGSLMLPYQFIPVSEECGLDIEIGYRMIEKICQYLADPIMGSLFECVDINLSIAQCEKTDLTKNIINITQKYDISPNRLNFEITESGFIDKLNIIERNIRLLTEYGFGFSLDDFGSGESNLDYLVEMPAKYLKLDMHMIWAYFKNDRAKKTVQSIIKISHDMGLDVIAEGVETKEQLDELSNQGVDYIQGYYFYKPMTITEYLQEVKKK